MSCCQPPWSTGLCVLLPAFIFITFFHTVLCFAGLHEVSRELENPFQNAPNDLPANNFHAQFNEALMTMFFGYHPDAYWEVKEVADESDGQLPLEAIDLGALVADLQGGGTAEQANQTDQDTAGQPIQTDHPLLSIAANTVDTSMLDMADPVDDQ